MGCHLRFVTNVHFNHDRSLREQQIDVVSSPVHTQELNSKPSTTTMSQCSTPFLPTLFCCGFQPFLLHQSGGVEDTKHCNSTKNAKNQNNANQSSILVMSRIDGQDRPICASTIESLTSYSNFQKEVNSLLYPTPVIT
ncbi:hypothetical protein LOAG_03868 [Loa loa]|uniref:Uncharacterized protein n=1 Tax=Loa loa TaxID=7209 RepID=A0A1S0U3X4_LOALO|nr:hypothetical protein LOAG_03868 [Loa loa]EFO24620.1 hypothetical protein LOAG_03868 [Loa loa]